MVLADLGADVTVVDRADLAVGASAESAKGNVYGRGRRSIAVDLKSTEGVEVVRRLTDAADVFIEGFDRASPSAWASAPTTFGPAIPG